MSEKWNAESRMRIPGSVRSLISSKLWGSLYAVRVWLPLDTRRKHLSSRAASYSSLRTPPRRHPILLWLEKNIHKRTARIAQRSSSTPFTKFQRCSLTETGRWKEILFRKPKLEKRFVRPERRRSSVVWCAALWAGGSPVRSPSFDRRLFRFSFVRVAVPLITR